MQTGIDSIMINLYRKLTKELKVNYTRLIFHLLPSDFIKQIPTGYLKLELQKRDINRFYDKFNKDSLMYFSSLNESLDNDKSL